MLRVSKKTCVVRRTETQYETSYEVKSFPDNNSDMKSSTKHSGRENNKESNCMFLCHRSTNFNFFFILGLPSGNFQPPKHHTKSRAKSLVISVFSVQLTHLLVESPFWLFFSGVMKESWERKKKQFFNFRVWKRSGPEKTCADFGIYVFVCLQFYELS